MNQKEPSKIIYTSNFDIYIFPGKLTAECLPLKINFDIAVDAN
ncbi:hypothetical protein [Dolichospermum sp. UHCC 0315A]|nr:hypothetical protein [Dolichospermum sp. UHCC 0315A]